MRSEGNSYFYWAILLCAFAGAATFLFVAIFLIVAATTGHGGHAGNILRVGLGLLSLFTALLFLAIGALYQKSAGKTRRNESR